MNRPESIVEKSTETLSFPQSEKGKLIVSSRKGNLIVLSGKHEISDEVRPLDLKLSEAGIERMRNIIQKNDGSPEKTAQHLGVPERWIHAVIQKYHLG